MTRKGLGLALFVVVPTAALVVWIANRTSWVEVKLPMPPKGEALVNPHYAAQRFAEALGATTAWDRMLELPGPDAVVVLSNWRWSLDKSRRIALQRWVESGGRLVVDDRLVNPQDEFEKWSGIVWQYPDSDPDTPDSEDVKEEDALCRSVREEFEGRPSSTAGESALVLCDLGMSWLESQAAPRWVLRDKKGIQAIRVSIGRGSVTAINASPFRERALFDGDHGRVFVAATGLHRGDEIRFVSEDQFPSLLELTWRYGAPAVALGLALLAAALWRGAVRVGPLVPPAVAARRSLADQIRGSGRFALRHGGGLALHAACVRALEEAARRRISRYALLTPDERSAALARATGFDRDSLAAAIHHPSRRTAGEIHRTLALLEAARRQTLMRHTRFDHDRR